MVRRMVVPTDDDPGSLRGPVRRASARRSAADEGQAIVEYSLILALVSIVALGSLAAVGVEVGNAFGYVVEQLNAAFGS